MTATALTPAVSQRIEVTVGECPNCECALTMTVDVRSAVKVSMQAEVGPTEITTEATSHVQGASVTHQCGTLGTDAFMGPQG